MQKAAFWGFFIFSGFTVLAAFGGGLWALFRQGGGARGIGFLLLFLGTTLTAMLAGLVHIQRKERRSFNQEGKQ